MKTEHAAFLKELGALLEKYNAVISFECDDCSDTYGLTGDCLTVAIKKENRYEYETIFKTYGGWNIDASDFKGKVR